MTENAIINGIEKCPTNITECCVCKHKILKGDIRVKINKSFISRGFTNMSYYHISCFKLAVLNSEKKLLNSC